jgi:TRAP-type C4-dicarboxylate transport system permease small subunit
VRGGSELPGTVPQDAIRELRGESGVGPGDELSDIRRRDRGPLGIFSRAIDTLNRAMLILGMASLVVAALILTYSVFSRYIFKAATDWQDEAAVFCIVGAVFLCGGYVQSWRGHIGIEALASVLPPAVNRVRLVVVDLVSLLFCAFFAWKSWTLLHEAWVDKMTSNSTWAPPLAIPYGLMSAGMTLLTLQVLVQFLAHFNARDARR